MSKFPTSLADSCVKCGLCLPHCPTFTLSQNEAESPRGRIGLMQGLATDRLPLSQTLVTHLEQCLACRRCEAVCPAQVPYGQLIDAARAEMHRLGHRPAAAERALIRVAGSARWRRLAQLALSVYYTARAQHWLPALLPDRLKRLTALLPRERPDPVRLDGHYAAIGARRGTVALFTGCMGPLLEPEVLADSVLVLRHAGFDVTVPGEQVCCGALALHAGYQDKARMLIHRNLETFGTTGADAIAFTASGCGATLREYSRLAEHPHAAAFAKKTHDVSWLIANSGWQTPAMAAQAEILLHEPCTMKNVVGEQRGVEALVRALTPCVTNAPDNGVCCGSAGAYVVTRPQIADRLLAGKLAALDAVNPAFIVTSNIGCALHLRAGLQRAGRTTTVVHPVSLVARELRTRRP